MPTVLAILADGFEEIEAITPIDLLRRAGAEVTIATLGDDKHVTGRNGITLHGDTPLAAVGEQSFDCVFLPGGPGVKLVKASEAVLARVRAQHQAGRLLAAICAAPTVLQAAGVLEGYRHTAHSAVADELPNMITTERVVLDRNILTSRGAGTTLDFGLAMVTQLFDRQMSDQIAKSIHA